MGGWMKQVGTFRALPPDVRVVLEEELHQVHIPNLAGVKQGGAFTHVHQVHRGPVGEEPGGHVVVAHYALYMYVWGGWVGGWVGRWGRGGWVGGWKWVGWVGGSIGEGWEGLGGRGSDGYSHSK